MYEVTNEAVRRRIEWGSVYGIWLEGDSGVLTADEIFRADSEQSSTSLSDDIELGAVCSAGWRVTTVQSGGYLGSRFRLYLYLADLSRSGQTTWGDLEGYTAGVLSKLTVEQVGRLGEILDGELIPMGEYTCVKAPRSGDGRELYLYDALYFADKPYTPTVTLPALASEVEADICEQLGVVCATDYTQTRLLADVNSTLLVTGGGLLLRTPSFNFTISEIPAGTTMRQMLGYIAGVNGQFGYIDRQGRYVRKWYGDPVLTIDSDHADEPTLSESANRIVGIRCMVGDTTLEIGQQSGGRVLELANPYMTEQLMKSLWSRVRDLSWYTAEVYHRLGDPRIDIGDMVTLETGSGGYDVPATNISYSYDGGLAASISAAGLTEEEQTI
ncbi:MAG: hypothetical protein IJ723_04250 [Ruminococcus sp.]|nr:hypothetical protein [Ruminococcus sp.]